jgi:hypothetical protein
MRSAVALSMALPFVLAACGGGNSSSAETPGPSINLQQTHASAEVQTISIAGWSGSESNTFIGTRTKTLSPATDISLNGQAALRRTVSYVDKISSASGAAEFDFAETIDANASTHAIIDVAEAGGSNVAPAYTVYEGYVPSSA